MIKLFFMGISFIFVHLVCCCEDPYFQEIDPWFTKLESQVSISLFPKDIACTIRPKNIANSAKLSPSSPPPQLPGGVVKRSKKLDLVVGLAYWEGMDSIIDGVSNALHFTNSQSTCIVLHINKHLGTTELLYPTYPKLENKMLKEIVTRTQKLRGSNRLLLNPYRIEVEWMSGSILLSHLANFRAARAVGWDPAYYMMVASNSRFFMCGIEAHIASTKLSFGFHDICNRNDPVIHKNIKNFQALTRAEPYGILARGQAQFEEKCCCHICSGNRVHNTLRSASENFNAIKKLFRLVLNFTDVSDSNDFNSTPLEYWQHNNNLTSPSNVNYRGIVHQRHEGAFYPSPVLDSLSHYLGQNYSITRLEGVDKENKRHRFANKIEGDEDSDQLNNGLFILADTPLPAEEFLLSTWMLHKFPHHIPIKTTFNKGTRAAVRRDISTYIVAGRGINATKDHIVHAAETQQYFLIKRVFKSPVKNIPNQCQSVFNTNKFKGGLFISPKERSKIFSDNYKPSYNTTKAKNNGNKRRKEAGKSHKMLLVGKDNNLLFRSQHEKQTVLRKQPIHWCEEKYKQIRMTKKKREKRQGVERKKNNHQSSTDSFVQFPDSIAQVNEVMFFILAGFTSLAIILVIVIYIIGKVCEACPACCYEHEDDLSNFRAGRRRWEQLNRHQRSLSRNVARQGIRP